MLPDAVFVAPDAPFPYDMAPFGRQWFSLRDRSGPALAAGIRAAAPILDAFIDARLAEHGLGDGELALVGFSQGTLMSLHVGLRRAAACAAIVGFRRGGRRRHPGRRNPVASPCCWSMAMHRPGGQPGQSGRRRQRWRGGVPVLAEMRPGLDHSIDGPGLALAAAFLRQSFGLPVAE